MSPILQALNLGYRVRSGPLLQGANLSVENGAFMAVVGPNGAGKTTLLRLLVGALSPGSGDVLLDGNSLRKMRRRAVAKRLSFVPQNTWTQFDITVSDAVAMGRIAHGGGRLRTPLEDVLATNKALREMDLEDLASRTLPSLSGGERQRVFLARALAQEASVLVLDEPMSSMDLRHQFELMDRLDSLHRNGKTIVIAVHDLGLVWKSIPECAVLCEGRLLMAGPTREVLVDPKVEAAFGVKLSADGDALHPAPSMGDSP